jgi:hypothetical protein
MLRRSILWISLSAATLAAQYGTTPKASELNYPANTKLGKLGVGAEYLVHSFSRGREMFIAKDYLVVEVALFPQANESMLVSAGQFALRVNGRKETIAPASAEIVASALRYPDTNTSTGLHPAGQLGPVVLGQPTPNERFPGDPNVPGNHPLPFPPDGNRNGIESETPVRSWELAVQAALPEGERREPASGFLYFPYRGKVGRIHALALVIAGPSGNVSLPLLEQTK